ncbi:hypothetical protein DSO57_1036426 [Entomophthora muscae]|uniref:Uncharacterized protein n=1 Tax=Entomophthora muscae TaxID=34485 RepID=A0ACC2U916_9FUNG|nr:hypothetical protein DSO57_1036426 [Entomophthora muscae]
MKSSGKGSSYAQLNDENTKGLNGPVSPPLPTRLSRKETQVYGHHIRLSNSNSGVSSVPENDFKLQIDNYIKGVTSSQDEKPTRYINNLSLPKPMNETMEKIGSSPAPQKPLTPEPSISDLDEEEYIVAQIEDNPYISQTFLLEESHSEKLWKRTLYLLMEDPSSSRTAFLVNIFLAGVILFSVMLTTIETIPAVRELQWKLWSHFELATVILFTLELCLRIAAHSGNSNHLRKFLTAPLTILDFLAVLPFYFTLLSRDDTSVEFRFTILRVFRLFRLFRAYKYSNLLQLSIEVMLIAVRKSLDALMALLFFMIITIVLFSTFLYFAERGSWDSEKKAFINGDGHTSTFDSIPAAFWFVIVTITTTGYGDIVPTTFLGKLIAFPLMMLGILLIALPSVIVGRNFTVVWDVLKRRRKVGLVPQSSGQRTPHQSLSEMMEGIELELASDPRVTQDGCVFPAAEQPSVDNPLTELQNEIIVHLKTIQSQQDNLALHLKALHDQSASNERQIALCTQLLTKVASP